MQKTKKSLYSMSFLKSLAKNWDLTWRLTERDILARYRGSLLGIAWTLITPLAMLSVYTFVFSKVFKARWGGLEETGALGFAINLFCGLIVFNLFSECATRSTGTIIANQNYVKKVVFPIEILSFTTIGSAAFHAITSLLMLFIFELIAFGSIPITVLWIPLVWTPLFLGCLACNWILSAAGVFIRDIGQFIGVAVQMLMFLSPVFFPVTALPMKWQSLLKLNPIAQVIQQSREVIVQGNNPSIEYLIYGIIISGIACEASYRIFCKSKRAFADVL